MTTKQLFDIANKQAKKLQKKQGLPEKGIVSTQVQGLIDALGMILGNIITLETWEEVEILSTCCGMRIKSIAVFSAGGQLKYICTKCGKETSFSVNAGETISHRGDLGVYRKYEKK